VKDYLSVQIIDFVNITNADRQQHTIYYNVILLKYD